MKLKELLKKTETLLDPDKSNRKEKEKSLKRVLRKLSKYEKKLIAEQAATTDEDEKARLKKKLLLVHAQRTKGVMLLKEYK